MCSKELHGGDQYYKIIPKEIRNSTIFSFVYSKNVYLVHHDYEEALKYVLEAERTGTPTDSDGLYRQSRKAKCYAGLGRFEEGLELANKCLQGYIEKDGKYHGNISETYNILKSCYEGLGDIKKPMIVRQKSLLSEKSYTLKKEKCAGFAVHFY